MKRAFELPLPSLRHWSVTVPGEASVEPTAIAIVPALAEPAVFTSSSAASPSSKSPAGEFSRQRATVFPVPALFVISDFAEITKLPAGRFMLASVENVVLENGIETGPSLKLTNPSLVNRVTVEAQYCAWRDACCCSPRPGRHGRWNLPDDKLDRLVFGGRAHRSGGRRG